MEVDGVITPKEQLVGVTMDLEQEQEQQEHEEDEVENEDEEGVEEGVEEGDGGGDNENEESLEIDKKRKRRRSAVWDEFDEVKGTNKMQCKHCKAQLQISGGTTSHFRRHLKGCARRMTNQKSQKISGFRSGWSFGSYRVHFKTWRFKLLTIKKDCWSLITDFVIVYEVFDSYIILEFTYGFYVMLAAIVVILLVLMLDFI
ncbi:uncharacterized protein LOC119981070 isoform X2 [Tripterygium wilfordii]|uniref:uncharacterized protein LOC119981070 isoform X2 n=1 Tax=Tripterygium wilfordii TaxID=458696 RepID=UPI0018F83F1C|nr:uncharacterized protein LOC119981070 isoform X2 [Tripterygium wilfordii]